MRLDSPVFFLHIKLVEIIDIQFCDCGLNRLHWVTILCMAAVCYVATPKLIYSWMVIDSVSHRNCIICMHVCEQLPVLLTLHIFIKIHNWPFYEASSWNAFVRFFFAWNIFKVKIFLWYSFFISWYQIGSMVNIKW